MSQGQGVDLSVEKFQGADGETQHRCTVRITDRKHHGLDANFQIVRKVEVHDSRPVHEEEVLFDHGFRCGDRPEEVFEVPGFSSKIYSYSGPHIDVALLVRVVVNDGYIWDTTVDEAIELPLFETPRVASCAKSLVDPEDKWEFMKNVSALPGESRGFTMLVAFFGMLFVTGNCGVGFHDMVAGRDTWLYPRGEPVAALFLSFFLSLVVGGIAAAVVTRNLKGYAELEVRPPRSPWGRGDTPKASELFQGRARTPLRGVELRIVACNHERGQYVRGHGTNQRTVSFSEPVRGVLLYSKRADWIPKGSEISSYFDDPIDLTPMFDGLYPPQLVSSTHGVDVYWEVQLLHDEYVDHEVQGEGDAFRWEDFLEARSDKEREARRLAGEA